MTSTQQERTVLFEIINPSDPYTMDAPDLEIAAIAVSVLGRGQYSLEGRGNAAGQDVPFFMFGGHDEWFTKNFGRTFEASVEHVLNQRADELATALESVKLERGERSSMNDIGGRAKSAANSLRAKTQQVPA